MEKQTLLTKCKKFEEKMHNFRNFGANDSEPKAYFVKLLRKKIKHKLNIEPMDQNWQLYSDVKGSKLVAKKMTASMATILRNIDKTPFSEINEVCLYYQL